MDGTPSCTTVSSGITPVYGQTCSDTYTVLSNGRITGPGPCDLHHLAEEVRFNPAHGAGDRHGSVGAGLWLCLTAIVRGHALGAVSGGSRVDPIDSTFAIKVWGSWPPGPATTL